MNDERKTPGPKDENAGGSESDVHRPASEEDSPALQDDRDGATQSWPGGGGPGTFPPPG
jgi:hypothetical protein